MLDPRSISDYKSLKERFPNITPSEKQRLEALERELLKEKGNSPVTLKDFIDRIITS